MRGAMACARIAAAAGVIALWTCGPALATQGDLFYAKVKAGQYEAAVALGSRYLAENPHDDAFAIDLAYAYLKIGALERVRAILRPRVSYLTAHPDAASIWLTLSFIDSDEKHYRTAIADVDRYLRYHPDDAQAWLQRGYAVAALTPAPPDESVSFYREVAAQRDADAIPYGREYLAAHPENASFAVDLAFAYLQTKNLSAASALAGTYAGYISSNANGLKLLPALFYAYDAAHDTAQALVYGREYLAARPNDDGFAIDLTYAELKAGNIDRAQAILAARKPYLQAHPDAAKLWLELSYREADAKRYPQAIADLDSYLALQPNDAAALSQRADYVTDLWGGPRATTYAYSSYEGRYNDIFLGADHDYTLAPNHGIQPYLAAHLTEDTRSGAPGTSQIFSDNALVTDAGLRQSITPNVTIYLEAGYGFGLRGQGTITDLRYGLTYGQQWGSALSGSTNVDASVALYSRYAGNTIGYYDVAHVFPGQTLRPIIGLNGGLDSHREYGNSFLEGIYGFDIGSGRLTYRILGVEGTYLTRGVPVAHPVYSSFRAMLVLGLDR